MKNTPLIIGVIIVLLAAAGGYFFMQSRSDEGMLGKKMAANGDSKMMSITDLMNLGANQMCTFSYADENGSVEGTSYIANGNVRTDFSGTDQDNAAYDGGMIIDSEYMYTWSSQMEQGVKVPVSAMDETMMKGSEDYADEKEEGYRQQIDPNEKVEYNCSNWNVDNSVFTPPSDVTFMDMSDQIKMMQQMMPSGVESMEPSSEGNSDIKSAQCAACDQAGEAADACRQALGC